MKRLIKINDASEIVAQEYNVIYKNTTDKVITIKRKVKPTITITVENSTDTAVLSLTCEKNTSVKGKIVWSSDLSSDVAKIEGTNLTFIQHYDGDVTLAATATNASATKTIKVTCDEAVTATTYTLGTVDPIDDVNATTTSATVNYTVIPIYHYPLKPSESGDAVSRSHEVTFEENTTSEDVTRSGSFTDADDVTVNWSLTQKGKLSVEFVDLGITNSSGKKVLWATCNIGAETEEGYGKYFQWGDTVGYEGNEALAHSTWATAPFNGGQSRYSSTEWGDVSGKTVTEDSDGDYNLNPQYDAATVAYGEGYRMPTKTEFTLLSANTTVRWEAVNDVYGYRFTSKQDTTKSIFVPAAGYVSKGAMYNVGTGGTIASSTLQIYLPSNMWCVSFVRNTINCPLQDARIVGKSIRAVLITD